MNSLCFVSRIVNFFFFIFFFFSLYCLFRATWKLNEFSHFFFRVNSAGIFIVCGKFQTFAKVFAFLLFYFEINHSSVAKILIFYERALAHTRTHTHI